MRTVSLFIACSLDGFIAGKDGRIDWLFLDQDYGYTEFLGSVDAAVMGRKTWDLARTFEPVPYPGKKKYIFSRRARKSSDKDVFYTASDPAAFVRGLKRRPGKKIWLVGGGEIIAILLNSGLMDEMVLSIHPLILGEGIRLFSGITRQSKWGLMKSKRFPTGLVQFTYLLKR